ncbi:MAG: methyltransferase [Clostridiales bacterium]|jgi:tRNA1(Val) A37 N6-methylase TrmN6|nr:methyltransferase [Clostridiales bacterium]
MPETRLENLGGKMTAVISKSHGFGTDSLLLAAFAAPKKSETVCDFGSGCGIMPLLWCRDGLCKSITALEIQKDACAQLEKAVELNGLSQKLKVINGDLRRAFELLPLNSFDLVTMNPPYKAPGAGAAASDEAASIARHEVACRFCDVADAAAKILRFGGRLCVCHRPERAADVICCMRSAGIEPKRIMTVTHKLGMKPKLILVEGKKGGKSGVVIEPELILNDCSGNYTKRVVKIYGPYNNKD